LQATRENKKSGEISQETRYFIASFSAESEKYAKLIRAHWSIEAFHWTLDITFKEDASRIRKDNAPENMAIIRKFAYNILKAEPTKKPVKRKFILAAINQTYREKLINLHNL
jgi:predicted transposase YbfD/YdcC